jgi:hypothetical protein
MATKYTKWSQNIPNGYIKVARFVLVQYTKTGKIYQMATNYTKWPQNMPNGHKIYEMASKYTKWPHLCLKIVQNVTQTIFLQNNYI